MSDTGGGHRAAAEAIQAAAAQRYPNDLAFTVVDVFRDYTPPPFKYAPEIYPAWVNNASPLWSLTYKMTNAPRRGQISANVLYYSWRQRIRQMFADHPADMVLSVHPIITRPIVRALAESSRRLPFMTVVTDLVTTHSFWYDRHCDRCLVPTQAAYERGLKNGLSPDQMRITGLPIHPNFISGLMSKAQARDELGLDPDLPAVLMVSGGDGMGPVYEIARAINRKALDCQLIIVAGRNQKLYQHLNQATWNQPTRIYGFVNFMPKLMAACDMLVSKAGPATITEASLAGLPVILSGAIPGQEYGNVTYVTDKGFGVYAPRPHMVAKWVKYWLTDGQDHLHRCAQHARQVAKPDAAREIVDEIYHMAYAEQIARAFV